MQRAMALHFGPSAGLTLAQRAMADQFMWGDAFLVAPILTRAHHLAGCVCLRVGRLWVAVYFYTHSHVSTTNSLCNYLPEGRGLSTST